MQTGGFVSVGSLTMLFLSRDLVVQSRTFCFFVKATKKNRLTSQKALGHIAKNAGSPKEFSSTPPLVACFQDHGHRIELSQVMVFFHFGKRNAGSKNWKTGTFMWTK